MSTDEPRPEPARRPVLAYIALWQFLSFSILLCLVWVNELLDLPALIYNAPSSPPDLIRACTLSAAVILCAVIAVGNTYTQQRHILKGLLVLCASCRKVRTSREVWEEMDSYIEEHSRAKLRIDTCPTCYEITAREVTDVNVKAWRSSP